ncbi:hypothetical protein FOA52_005335 [Chlamydomonas sp. UWO 241]|nr:hypothetical protein FOA52_005335 [Chlamydomonas sp. UWO 241]
MPLLSAAAGQGQGQQAAPAGAQEQHVAVQQMQEQQQQQQQQQQQRHAAVQPQQQEQGAHAAPSPAAPAQRNSQKGVPRTARRVLDATAVAAAVGRLGFLVEQEGGMAAAAGADVARPTPDAGEVTDGHGTREGGSGCADGSSGPAAHGGEARALARALLARAEALGAREFRSDAAASVLWGAAKAGAGAAVPGGLLEELLGAAAVEGEPASVAAAVGEPAVAAAAESAAAAAAAATEGGQPAATATGPQQQQQRQQSPRPHAPAGVGAPDSSRRPKALAMAAWGGAACGTLPTSPSWHALADACAHACRSLSGREVSNVLWALATVARRGGGDSSGRGGGAGGGDARYGNGGDARDGGVAPETRDALMARLGVLLGELNAQDVSSVCWALGALGWRAAAAPHIGPLSYALARTARAMTPRQLAPAVWGIGRLSTPATLPLATPTAPAPGLGGASPHAPLPARLHVAHNEQQGAQELHQQEGGLPSALAAALPRALAHAAPRELLVLTAAAALACARGGPGATRDPAARALLLAAAPRLARAAPGLDDASVASALWAYARGRAHHAPLADALAARAAHLARDGRMGARAGCTTVWALARLRPGGAREAAAGIARAMCHTADVSGGTGGAASAGTLPSAATTGAANTAAPSLSPGGLERASAASLCNLLWGLDALRVAPPFALLDIVMPLLHAELPNLKRRELATVLAALAGLGACDAQLFDRAAALLLWRPHVAAAGRPARGGEQQRRRQAAEEEGPAAGSGDGDGGGGVGGTAAAAAALGSSQGGFRALRRRMAFRSRIGGLRAGDQALSLVEQLQPFELAKVAWAFARVQHVDESLFGAIRELLLRLCRARAPAAAAAPSATPTGTATFAMGGGAPAPASAPASVDGGGGLRAPALSRAMWAFATLGLDDEDLFAALSRKAAGALSAQDVQPRDGVDRLFLVIIEEIPFGGG